jgi:hypothetical protein
MSSRLTNVSLACSYDDLVSEVKFYRVFINSAQFSSICYRVYVYIHGAVILVTPRIRGLLNTAVSAKLFSFVTYTAECHSDDSHI